MTESTLCVDLAIPSHAIGARLVGYLLNLIAKESDHQMHLPEFEKLLASVEHLGD